YPSTDSCGNKLCNCGFSPWYWNSDDGQFDPYPFQSAEPLTADIDNAVFVHGMNPGGPYTINFYDVNAPLTLVVTNYGAGEIIPIPFPMLSLEQPVLLFHMFSNDYNMAPESNNETLKKKGE